MNDVDKSNNRLICIIDLSIGTKMISICWVLWDYCVFADKK
jgi:hypothetical protein